MIARIIFDFYCIFVLLYAVSMVFTVTMNNIHVRFMTGIDKPWIIIASSLLCNAYKRYSEDFMAVENFKNLTRFN